MVRNWDWYGHIYADHAYFDLRGEPLSSPTVACENCHPIAIGMAGGMAYGILQALRSDHLQYRAEYLFLIAAHRRFNVIQQSRPHEKAAFVTRQGKPSTINDNL